MTRKRPIPTPRTILNTSNGSSEILHDRSSDVTSIRSNDVASNRRHSMGSVGRLYSPLDRLILKYGEPFQKFVSRKTTSSRVHSSARTWSERSFLFFVFSKKNPQKLQLFFWSFWSFLNLNLNLSIFLCTNVHPGRISARQNRPTLLDDVML